MERLVDIRLQCRIKQKIEKARTESIFFKSLNSSTAEMFYANLSIAT